MAVLGNISGLSKLASTAPVVPAFVAHLNIALTTLPDKVRQQPSTHFAFEYSVESVTFQPGHMSAVVTIPQVFHRFVTCPSTRCWWWLSDSVVVIRSLHDAAVVHGLHNVAVVHSFLVSR